MVVFTCSMFSEHVNINGKVIQRDSNIFIWRGNKNVVMVVFTRVSRFSEHVNTNGEVIQRDLFLYLVKMLSL